MNMLKITLLTVVVVLSVFQANSVKAEEMNIVKYLEVEKEQFISFIWRGHRDIWVGHFVGKNHKLAVVDFQGAKVSSGYKDNITAIGVRVVDTRYYSDTGYLYAKLALDLSVDGNYDTSHAFSVAFNYNVMVYDGTYAGNARSSY